MLNRLVNCKNHYQGQSKRVLCLCSAGLLRSPTVAWVLSNPPYNYNTRAAGVSTEYALIPVDDVLLEWADIIVCVSKDVYKVLGSNFSLPDLKHKDIRVLDIPDIFAFKDPKLIEIIRQQFDEVDNVNKC